jgi:Flp pilus assembly protein TadG
MGAPCLPRWRTRGRAAPASPESGAAVVEFVLISVLLIFLLFGVIQVAVYYYVRNIVAASAADGARYAATSGVDARSGATRASQLIAHGLTADAAADITCTGGSAVDAASGLPVATVHCRGPLRALFLPLDLPLRVDVTSSVLEESAP